MVNNSFSCIMWDEAFYDDPLFSKVESNTNEVNFLKRPMTLDLNPCNNENSSKKLKLQPTILTSPDLSMLEFNSPQLESFDLSQQTTLGDIISTPSPSLISKFVTVEQEMYVQPFVEAIHHNENSNGDIQVEIPMTSSDINSSEYQSEPPYCDIQVEIPMTSSDINSSEYQSEPPYCDIQVEIPMTSSDINSSEYQSEPPYCDIQVEIPMTSSDINSSEYQSEPPYCVLVTLNDFSNFMPHNVIIEEPQTVPSVTSSSRPMPPTDIESKEKIKLEEKRKRNRVAASKCRLRKLERNAKLRDNIKVLKNENIELTTELSSLLEQICQLKQTIVEHMKNGCEFPTAVALNNEHS